MNEKTYERTLKSKIRQMFPGCMIMKNDPTQHQGIPDILILHNSTWAMLEVKMDATSEEQPNQRHYVEKFRKMSYASFVHPGNEAEVLHDLQQTFSLGR